MLLSGKLSLVGRCSRSTVGKSCVCFPRAAPNVPSSISWSISPTFSQKQFPKSKTKDFTIKIQNILPTYLNKGNAKGSNPKEQCTFRDKVSQSIQTTRFIQRLLLGAVLLIAAATRIWDTDIFSGKILWRFYSTATQLQIIRINLNSLTIKFSELQFFACCPNLPYLLH